VLGSHSGASEGSGIYLTDSAFKVEVSGRFSPGEKRWISTGNPIGFIGFSWENDRFSWENWKKMIKHVRNFVSFLV